MNPRSLAVLAAIVTMAQSTSPFLAATGAAAVPLPQQRPRAPGSGDLQRIAAAEAKRARRAVRNLRNAREAA